MSRLPLFFVIMTWSTVSLAASEVSVTKHNMSVSGPGPLKSQTEDRICFFCHTPHLALDAVQLWNRRPGVSTSMLSENAPSGSDIIGSSSALCLSCHDGTVALGNLRNPGNGRVRGPGDLQGTFLSGRSNLGIDLSDDHPVAINYETQGRRGSAGLKIEHSVDLPIRNGQIQCISCHDAHDDTLAPFLHRSTTNGELCISCHELGGRNWEWSLSSHAVSIEEARGKDPWPERKPEWKGSNVAQNACMNCHAPHNAQSPNALVVDVEENACYRCHDGTLSRRNIQADKQKFFRHPVERVTGSRHGGEKEDPRRVSKHVECEDCHNPHASQPDQPLVSFRFDNPLGSVRSNAPYVNGSLLGVSGIDIRGSFKQEADYEFEVCFKCHGLPGKSACDNRRCETAVRYDMARQDDTYNLREKLDPSNPALQSYHPIENNDPDNNDEVPSLRNDIPLNRSSSRIYCGDCHSSDVSPAAGGSGPSGPHGSINEGILAFRYEFNPQSNFSWNTSMLCFKCHDASSIYGNDSFLHREHVIDQGASCINCHDPHGSAAFPHLINFLTNADVSGRSYQITGTGTFTEPTWQDLGRYTGSCSLSCHGVVHDDWTYPTFTSEN